jgi:predicted TIM-barrel enzyme
MAHAGADVLVCHLGLTAGGAIGAQTVKSLDDCVNLIDKWAAAARSVRDDIFILCHGGPISEPEDAAYVLRHATIDGFYGASSLERLPAERSLIKQARTFTEISF